jgi:hypothetical protein
MAVKPGKFPKYKRLAELFRKENLKVDIWTDERESDVEDQT